VAKAPHHRGSICTPRQGKRPGLCGRRSTCRTGRPPGREQDVFFASGQNKTASGRMAVPSSGARSRALGGQRCPQYTGKQKYCENRLLKSMSLRFSGLVQRHSNRESTRISQQLSLSLPLSRRSRPGTYLLCSSGRGLFSPIRCTTSCWLAQSLPSVCLQLETTVISAGECFGVCRVLDR
jgi:hypothetical protein